MTQHDHREYVEGCFRCGLSRDETVAETFRREAFHPSRPWRMEEWNALPDICFIAGCDSDETDPRGPVSLRDGSIHKACPEHWEPIFRVLGEQVTWESTDAMRSGGS